MDHHLREPTADKLFFQYCYSCTNAGGVHVLPNINNVALMIYSACGYLESLKHDLPPDEYGQRIQQHSRTGNSYALLVRLMPRREQHGNQSD